MKEIVVRGRKVVAGHAKGEALVTKEPISFMGGVDPTTGTVVEKGHELEGLCITGKVLVFPMGKGSTGGSYMIYEMSKRGTGPIAILNQKAEPVVAIGAVISKIPMMDRFAESLNLVSTGDHVEINADTGLVKIFKQELGRS